MSSNKNSTLEDRISQFSQSIPAYEKCDNAALQTILNNIGLLAIAAGENKRMAFQDTCLLVQKKFSAIIEKSNTLNNKQFELLQQWRILASNYIKDSKPSTINELTTFFKRPDLNSNITKDELSRLNNLLEQESHQFEILFSEIIDCLKKNNSVEPNIVNEKFEILLLSIGEENLTGFLDVFLLLQENVSDIASENKLFNDKQSELLLNWLNQAEIFLSDKNNTNAASELINILKYEVWPTALSEIDAKILFEMFGINTDESSLPKMPESLLDLFNKLESATTNISADNKQSILDVADITEEIGLAAGDLDMLGFQDICLIIKENLSDMVSDKSLSLQDYVAHVEQWLDLVKNYLLNRDDLSFVQNMLDYLTDTKWPNPMGQADLPILKDMLGIAEQSTDKMDLTVVTSDEGIHEVLNETLDNVVNTKDAPAAPHTISKDLIQMLQEEIVIIQDEARNHIELIKDGNTDDKIISDALSQYALYIERFGNACQAAELDGLYQVSSVFSKNLNHISENEIKLSEHQQFLLFSWPEKVFAYLQTPSGDTCSEELAKILQDDALPKKLLHGVAPALINLLKAVYISDKETYKEVRQTVATAEDVSIELPADINQELLDGLLQELPGQTEELSSAIQSLIDGSGNIKEVQKAQRIAHTVKGAANTVGVKGIATLTHHLEDIFTVLNDLNQLPSLELSNVFMDAADCLEEMSEALLERGASPDNSQQVLQQTLDWANRIESEGADCLISDQVKVPTSVSSSKENEEEDKPEEEDSSSTATLRVPTKLIDEVLRLLGETMIVTSQLQERVHQSTLQSEKLIEHQNMVKNLTSDLEVHVDINGSVYTQKQAVNQNAIFDPLELEEYNELHTVTNQIVEAAVDSYEFNQKIANDLRELDELLIERLQLHNEIQELVMRTRMAPIKTIVPRLQRIVRQICRTTKKQAALDISGSDTLIDSNIINKLIDPLMHMLRNAIDHGIETREKRIQLKKEPEGKLKLSFFREGTQIVVRCEDDGAGLNHEKIIEKAIKQDLIKANDKLSESEINRLILHPGFSTREQATQTSGRGVGMDIVHTELLAMKGSVHIESEKNKGCLIELRMPVTLMSSHALLLRHLNQTIVISNRGVEKILHPTDVKIIEIDNETLCEVDGEKLQILTLESLLNLPADKREGDRAGRPALLIREEELNYVVYIQEIFDTRDLFIKSMGKYLNNVKGMLGATILGDGSVVPVVDLPELIRAPVVNIQGPNELTQTDIHRALPVALVIDDSLSARRALVQVIQDAGFDVRTAKDGIEAVGIIEKMKPDIILVDMEMPRMNGMELTSHVRGFERTKDIPVIMITSRSTDKHRKQAEASGVDIYVTKPFSEDDLLDQVHSLLS